MTLLGANGQNVFYKGIAKLVLESVLLTWISSALCYLNLLEKVRAPHQHHQPTGKGSDDDTYQYTSDEQDQS